MKKKILWIVAILVIVVIAVFINTSNSADTKGPIKIGLISILSGEYSAVGENLANGALLAQDVYNKNNPDSMIELILEDDGFDSKKALSAYKKLTSIDNVDALINVSTPAIGAIYDDVIASNIPVIQAGEQPVAPTDDNVFQILPGNIPLEKELGEYVKAQGFQNPVLVYTQHDTMIRFKNAFLEGYGSGMTEMVSNPADTDQKTLVTKIIAEKPDALILLAFPQSGAQILNEYLKQAGTLPQIVLDVNAQSGFADYVRILGDANILNGTIIATVQQEISTEFIRAYKEKFGAEPGFFADLGYDALNALIETQNSDRAKWVTNIKNAKLTGVTGAIQFDRDGVRLPMVKIVTITDGAIPQE